jgi:cytochrome c oxidase subunit 1
MNTSAPAAVFEGAPNAEAQSGLFSWVATVDHKRIGILYMLTTLCFFAVGGVEALLIRIQLVRPGNHFLSPDAFNQIFTMHGTTMIFLVVMPDDRREGHGIPAPERDELLAAAVWRPASAL